MNVETVKASNHSAPFWSSLTGNTPILVKPLPGAAASDFFCPFEGPFGPKRPLRHSHGFEHPGQAHSLAWADKGALVQVVCATAAHTPYAKLTADACVLACSAAASAGVACRRP